MTTLPIKEPLTIQNIINSLAENPKKTDFKNTEMMRYAYFNRKLAPTLEFENVTFENATFTSDFLDKVYFNRCTFKNCKTTGSMPMEYGSYTSDNLPLEEVQVEGLGATFENCIFDNFKWELHQPMKNVFEKCEIINNSNFSYMNLVYGEFSKCRIEDSIFTPKLYFSQNGDEQEGGSIFENNTIINCDLVGIELASANCNEFINCKIEEFFAPPYFKNNSFTDIKSMRVYFNKARSTNFYINVSFEYSDFTNATLSGSLFKNCDLSSDTNYLINATFSLADKDEIKLTDKQLATDVIFI
jgi:uncharacterized protein YjbI with pentapeptide repeats